MEKKQPSYKVEYSEPKFEEIPQTDFRDLAGLIATVSAAPTWTPRKFSEQFAIMTSGGTLRFYWYDRDNGAWHYVTATA